MATLKELVSEAVPSSLAAGQIPGSVVMKFLAPLIAHAEKLEARIAELEARGKPDKD